MSKINVGIIGASGYTGLELLKLIIRHPKLDVRYICSESNKGKTLASINPYFKNKVDLIFERFNESIIKEKCDVLFFATPNGVAMNYAPLFYDSSLKIIDMSGDFRLASGNEYLKWYGKKHSAVESLNLWVYGLSEIFRNEIKNARLISNPGCYPTSILLAILPLLKLHIPTTAIICDGKSAVSGKGKKLSLDSLFFECNENLLAYKINYHQHIPEIEQGIYKFINKNMTITFTPHLIPMDRGILSTIYINLDKAKLSIENIRTHYSLFYKNEYFIKVLQDEAILLQTKNVAFTNECHISLHLDRRTNILKIVCVIDNLIKGAVGTALQNLNIMFSLDEKEGLL